MAPTAAQAKKQQHIFSPVSVADIAMWTDYCNKAAIRLTERGDILLFRNRKPVFAKILSQWRHFPHGAIMEKIFLEEISQEEKEVRKVVYLALLDMAFDGRTARIGIPGDPKRKRKRLEHIHSRFRFSPILQAERKSLLTTIPGIGKFHAIPGKIRASVCTLNDVLIFGPQGDVFAGEGVQQEREGQAADAENALSVSARKSHDPGIRILESGYVKI